MPTLTEVRRKVTALDHLRIGDLVEARQLRGSSLYRGEVDIVVPEQGILWILHGSLKERILLDASEYELSQCFPPRAARSRATTRSAASTSLSV